MQPVSTHDASIDRHGASSSASGASAAAGRGAESIAGPRPAGACPTEIPEPFLQRRLT
jgi:hypothetical protein